ncbi:MAG TPA: Ig-like domain-containing protein [Roseibacillus sp.]|jgi:hypothetical protein|nr:Ig-like domain-containing protein [Roseibacillus sp.]
MMMNSHNPLTAVRALAAGASAILVLATAQVTAQITAGDLTNYWQLDGDLTDSVGSANGTIVDQDGGGDNTSFSTGFDGTVGGALSFTGTTDHVATGAFTVPLGTKSMSLFFTMTSATNQVFAGAGNGQRFYFGGRANGAAWVGLGLGGAGSTPLPSADFTPTGTNIAFNNTYHHMVLNDNGSGTRTIYYRSPSDLGYSISTAAYTGTTGGVADFLIGALGNGGVGLLFADGRIDDVALFNRMLNQAEVESIWAAGSVAAALVSDTIDPTLTETNPPDDATNVPTAINLVATFSETVQAGTGLIELKKATGDVLVESFDVTTAPSAQLTFSGATVTINPTNPLEAGVEYYVLIPDTAVKDGADNFFDGISAPPDPSKWSFTTDATPPVKSDMGPVADATGVPVSTGLTLSFDEVVLQGSGNIVVHLAADGSAVQTIEVNDAAVTVSGTEVTIDLDDLDFGTHYYVTIDSGAFTDLSGNPFAGISDPAAWSFTTQTNFITAEDLVAYWQLDGDLTDSVGSANGTIVDQDGGGNNTSFATGFDGTAGGALNFAGTTDHVATGAFTVPLGTKSMSLFFTMNSATNQVFAGANNGQRFYFGGRANGAAWVGLGLGGAGSTPLPSADFTPTGTNIAFDNTYHHMVLNDNGSGTRTLYYRSPSDSGYLVSTAAYTGTTGGVGDFLIGALGNGGAAVLNLVANGRIDDVALFNRELTAAEVGSIWDAGSVAAAITGPDPLVLKISRNGGNLDFEWNSLSGMQYDLVSSTDLSSAPATWPPYDDGVTTYENIPASGTDTNTLSGVVPLGGVRFFALTEEPIPPLLSEGFEGGLGGFTVVDHSAGETGTDWAAGAPISGSAGAPNPGGFVDSGNGGSANCVGTDIGDPGFHSADTDTCLRSPVIDLTGVAGATLSFAQALDIEAADTAVVNIIDDTDDNPATNVISAAIYTATDGDPSNAPWASVAPIAIPGAALGQAVRIEWRFTGAGAPGSDYMGWYIDDVVVTPTTP